MLLGMVPGMSLTAMAETYSESVHSLQQGDILEPGAEFDSNDKSITLQANGYCTAEGYGEDAIYTQGTTDVSFTGSGFLRVLSESDRLGAIEVLTGENLVWE